MDKKKKKRSKKKSAHSVKKQRKEETLKHPTPVPHQSSEQEVNQADSLLRDNRAAKKQFWAWLLPVLRATTLMVIGVLVLVAAIYFGFEYFYQTRTLPNTFVGSIPVGGFSYDEAQTRIAENFQSLASKPLAFIVDDVTYQIPFAEAGITYDFTRVMANLQQRKPHDVWRSLFWPTYVKSGLTLDQAVLAHALQRNIPSISIPPKNASVYLAQDSKKVPYFSVIPAEIHRTANFQQITATVNTMIEQGHALPVLVRTFEGIPEITDEEAYEAIRASENWLKKTVSLVYDRNGKKVKTTIDPEKDWEWLEFISHEGKLVITLNSNKWDNLLSREILPAIEQKKQDVIVALPAEGKRYATVSGELSDGYTVDKIKTREAVEATFNSTVTNQLLQKSDHIIESVSLVVNYEQARFISTEGQDLGLKDILGIGHSRFVGSSSARNFNIRKGLAIYNNLLLAPGEKLSFNSLLGPVTVKAGWKEELVIKEGGKKTVPEAGGGLCQVSTTMYRALIESGLKVLERRAHSYLVSYYVGEDDPRSGIDATIYPGSQDLVFVNDTANYMLIQTDTSGVDAYVRIYGTHDGRKVTLDGPFKSGWVSPGGPILVPTADLPAGKVKITKAAHNGRTVRWTQNITRPDGTVETHDIVSVYKAIPAEGLVGSASAVAFSDPSSVSL
ncbi:MAG: VanW family protein [Candidatus Abawacabacteria bacterium]|nr:VanW family protein [Candidatus Abawacabacteria bacterium]